MNPPTPIFQTDRVALYHGDCREILPALHGIGAVVCDPPYGIERFRKGIRSTRFSRHARVNHEGLWWDTRPDPATFDMLLNTGRVRVIWGANNFTLPPSQAFFVWHKMQTVPNFADAEIAWTDAVGVTAKVFSYPIATHNRRKDGRHPTEKPVCVMAWAMEQARIPVDALVCDPYCGTGATLLAALETGRRAVGIELDAAYAATCRERLEAWYSQGRLAI